MSAGAWPIAMLCALMVLPARSVAQSKTSEDDEAIQLRLREYWITNLLAPIAGTPQTALNQAPVEFPAEQRALALREVRRYFMQTNNAEVFSATLSSIAPAVLLGDLRFPDSEATERWPSLAPPQGTATAPSWLIEAAAQNIREMSLTSKKVEQNLPLGMAPERSVHAWPTPSGMNDGQTPEADALAWAGPAVKDGVAAYQIVGGKTIVRIAAGPDQAAVLYTWADHLGLPVAVSLDNSGEPLTMAEPLPILLRTAVPAWIVTPEGLAPATLKGLRTGDICQGGGWLELQLANSAQPRIWAILLLPDRALAKSVTVRRVQKAADKDAWLTGFQSELRVEWPQALLPPLQISARRYDWAIRISDDENERPTVLGSAWGTQIRVATKTPQGAQDLVISGAGTPQCAPQ